MITHRMGTSGFEVAEPTPLAVRPFILAVEDKMRELPGMEIEPIHHFSKGLYARELRIPAGTLLTGKIHKFENLNIVHGDISVLTEEGVKRIQALDAPCTIVSPPGTKRIGYAHSDTVWICVHASEETDLEALEDELISASFEEFESFQLSMKKEAACLGER